jgi:hypothetical protein
MKLASINWVRSLRLLVGSRYLWIIIIIIGGGCSSEFDTRLLDSRHRTLLTTWQRTTSRVSGTEQGAQCLGSRAILDFRSRARLVPWHASSIALHTSSTSCLVLKYERLRVLLHSFSFSHSHPTHVSPAFLTSLSPHICTSFTLSLWFA